MNILLADNNELFVTGMLAVLQALGKKTQITHLDNGGDVLHHLSFKEPVDIALIDLDLPKIDAFELLRKIRKNKIDTPIIVLSNSNDAHDIQKIMQLGAMGFLCKDCDRDSVYESIKSVLCGEKVIFSDLSSANVQDSLDWSTSKSGKFSHYQRKILRLLKQGKSKQEIRQILQLSKASVRSHVNSIYDSLTLSTGS